MKEPDGPPIYRDKKTQEQQHRTDNAGNGVVANGSGAHCRDCVSAAHVNSQSLWISFQSTRVHGVAQLLCIFKIRGWTLAQHAEENGLSIWGNQRIRILIRGKGLGIAQSR